MVAFESLQIVAEFREKFPKPAIIFKDMRGMRARMAGLIKVSSIPRKEMAKAIGLREAALFARMTNPMLWKEEEMEKLLKLLDLI